MSKTTGKSILSQVFDQLWLQAKHSIGPPAYYQYQLFQLGNKDSIDEYLFQEEALTLFRSLNKYKRFQAIENKQFFGQFCKQHHLPSIPTLQLYCQGRAAFDRKLPPDPQGALFVKPTEGARGEGASLWRYLGDGLYQSQDYKSKLDWPELNEHLRSKSLERDIMVQPRLVSPQLRPWSLEALATIRVVTGCYPNGETIIVAATFKMAVHLYEVTDNLGLCSAVDLETGRLGKAFSYHPLCQGYTHHPLTNAAIEGQKLPMWREAITLSLCAHRLFRDVAFLGWDLGLTETGPVLLEVNSGWDVLSVQKPQGRPLGSTIFADVCLAWTRT